MTAVMKMIKASRERRLRDALPTVLYVLAGQQRVVKSDAPSSFGSLCKLCSSFASAVVRNGDVQQQQVTLVDRTTAVSLIRTRFGRCTCCGCGLHYAGS
jgi:hypothetical protein